MMASHRKRKIDISVGVTPSAGGVAQSFRRWPNRSGAERVRELPFHLRLIALLLVFIVPSLNSRGAVLYWDTNLTPLNNVFNQAGAGQGGQGTLDLSAPLWWTGSAANQGWNNAANDTAVFGGTAGTVTLGTGVNLTAGGLQFNQTGYTLNLGANTLTFGGATNVVTLNTLSLPNATTSVNAVMTGAVAGTGDLSLSGGLAAGLVGNVLTRFRWAG